MDVIKKLNIYLLKIALRVFALAIIAIATHLTIIFKSSEPGLSLIELLIKHWDLLLILNLVGLIGMVILDFSYNVKNEEK